MADDAVKRSMRLPGEAGGSPLMDYNGADGGQMRQRSLADVVTPAIPGQITGPIFSSVSLPVEGGVREVAGPAPGVPKSPDRSQPGVRIGPTVRSAPGGDVFPKGSGTVADPGLPSAKPRVLPANAIESFADGVMPPVPGYRAVPGVVTPSPTAGLQPGESAGLLPRKAE